LWECLFLCWYFEEFITHGKNSTREPRLEMPRCCWDQPLLSSRISTAQKQKKKILKEFFCRGQSSKFRIGR
jgi:hypothetical protein